METKTLQPGVTLVFRVKSEVTYRNKTCYQLVSASGPVFVHDQIKRLLKVRMVDFLHDDSRGSRVIEYLRRHGQAQGLTAPLPNDGYTMHFLQVIRSSARQLRTSRIRRYRAISIPSMSSHTLPTVYPYLALSLIERGQARPLVASSRTLSQSCRFVRRTVSEQDGY